MFAFKSILFLYFLGLHIILLFIFLKPEIALFINTQIYDRHQEVTFGDHYNQMVLFHNRVDKNVPQGVVAFVGDSITQGLAVSAVAPLAVNFGIGGDTTEGVLRRIDSLDSLKRSSIVVLAIGVNDLKHRSDAEIVSSYNKILHAMHNYPSVLVSAILPVDEKVFQSQGYNTRIAVLNKQILNACFDYENCSFLDVGDKLLNGAGQLDSNYHIGDGLHLNPEGYDVWIEGLKSALVGISKP